MIREKGFSLIESILVVVVLGSIAVLMANFPNAMGLINKSRNLSSAREIAAKQIEDKRSITYSNLVNDTSAISDSRISMLPLGGGTVVVKDCDESICTQGENIKQITVTVSWREGDKDQSVQLQTFITEGGLNQ